MSNGNDPTQQSPLPSPPPSSLPSPSPSSLPSPPPSSNVDTSTSSPPPISSLPSPPSFSPPAPPSTSTPSTGSDPSSSSKPSSHTPTHSSSSTTTTTENGSTSTSDSSSTTNDVSTGLVAGLAVGGVVLLVFITLFFLCCRGRSKKKRRPDDDELHVRPPKGETYGGEVHGWQHNVPPPTDHVVQLQPRISPPPVHASRPPLPPLPPPPPPPIFSSTGDSGSNYSGSENPLPPPSPSLFLGLSKSTFTFEELMLATGGFSDANLLGQGGFGYVHRGMLPNGKEIAVKQLKSGSGQGDREFQAEVETISRVHHKHLVSLVGYCIARNKRLLVYEFVPNNTLEFHLHEKGRPCLDWSTRLKIALGSAKGLAYLHEDCNPKIIHRDIKSANILLDFKFEPKVADFGLAKFSSDNNTHVSTRVMGTFGYMAPEYASSGKLTEKSDVFSYGVMLLELITGNRPVDTTNSYTDDSLVDWARPLLTRAIEEENYSILSDPRLQQSYNNNEMARCVACAAACVRHSAKRRPRMSQVVRALEGDASLDNLNDGVKPGHSSAYGSYGSSDYDQYQEEMKRFRKLALGGQEYPGDECDDATRDYVQHPPGSSNGVPAARDMSSTTTRNARLASRGFR